MIRTLPLCTAVALVAAGPFAMAQPASAPPASSRTAKAPPLEFRVLVEADESAANSDEPPVFISQRQLAELKRQLEAGNLGRRGIRWAPAAPSVSDLSIRVEHEGTVYTLVAGDQQSLAWDGKWKLLRAEAARMSTGLAVELELDSTAAKRMKALTEAHLGRRLAILIGGRVAAAPTIRSVIAGEAMLTGEASEVRAMVEVLGPAVRAAGPASSASASPIEGIVKLPLEGPAVGEWFYPDPYSQLGQLDENADWNYLRLLVDAAAVSDLGIPKAQAATLRQLRETTLAAHRVAAKEKPPAEAAALQAKLWSEAATSAKRILTRAQQARIEKLMLQRKTYRAFQDPAIVEQLELSPQQQQGVAGAIQGHLSRLREMDSRLRTELLESRRLPPDEQADFRERMRTWRAKRSSLGRLSYVQAWNEIHRLLTPEQRAEFNRLRGPLPASALPALGAYRQ